MNLNAGEQSASANDEHYHKENGFLSSKSTHTIDSSSHTNAVGTTLSGNSVAVQAGNDLTAKAATIAATNDVSLTAGHDLTVTTADTASSEYHYKDVKKSGLGSAGAGISYGTNQTIDTSRDTVKGSQGSLIGSTDGSVSMVAGNTLHVTGSDIVAGKDVTGIAKEVTIDASQTDRHHEETHEVKSSGFTLAVKSPVIDAIQNVNQQAQGAGGSQDGRAAALHAIAAAGGMADLVGATGSMTNALNDPKGKVEAKVELSFGSSHSKSTFTENSTQNNGSSVKAGGTAAFVATGDKNAGQGNVTIQGSDVSAKDVLLQATNKVNLVNSTDTDSTRSTNESKSASVGVSYGTGGFGVSASMSRAHGDANSDAATQNNTHINASNTATIISGGDTNIVGANVSANKVIADVGGNLNLASVQDTSRSEAHQSSSGGGFSVSQGGASASVSMQNGHASGNYAGVNEQAGIQAGDGGFDITVKGNTDLKGAYIASTATPDKNQLTTGTLSFSDIQNSSSYNASSFGLSAGGGVGNGGNNYATHGQTSGKNTGGGQPLYVSESDSSSASTKSAISEGTITITDQAHQKQDVVTLSRDTTGLNGTVSKTPDLQQVLSNQSDLINAAQAAAETIAKQIGNYADRKQKEAQQNADSATDPALKAQYQQDADSWAEGGGNRIGLHIAGGALTGGLTGGGLGAVGGAAGGGVSAKLAPQLNEIAQSIKDAGPTGNKNVDELLGNVTSNLLAGGAGALVGGGTGALTGASVDRFNRQLHPDEYARAKKDAKIVAQKLGISVEEAEGRIVAEILRNSDKQAAEVSRGKHDYEIRSIVGCQNLNCDGYKNDPQYTNHNYNGQYIKPNHDAYDRGQQQLGRGQTYNDLVTSNVKNDPVGSTLAGAGMIGLGVVTAGGIPSAIGMATGGGIGAAINSGAQYVFNNGKINPVDTVMAGVTGALTFGTGLMPGLVINTGGSLAGSAYKGENPNTGIAGAVAGSMTGYVIGGKIEGLLNTKLNPWYQPAWIDLGLGISKPASPSVLPSVLGTSLGASGSETTNGVTGILLNPPPAKK